MGSHVAAPVLTPNVKYDSERDFDPIGLTAHAPAVIVARKDFPAMNGRRGVPGSVSNFSGVPNDRGVPLKPPSDGVARLVPSGDSIRDDFYGGRSHLNELYVANHLLLNSLGLGFEKVFCFLQLPN
jgi:hypothetical protein